MILALSKSCGMMVQEGLGFRGRFKESSTSSLALASLSQRRAVSYGSPLYMERSMEALKMFFSCLHVHTGCAQGVKEVKDVMLFGLQVGLLQRSVPPFPTNS